MFRLANDKRLTVENLGGFINKHSEIVQSRYKPLMDAYRTKYPNFYQKSKPNWKPDKRIAVNFAKYITDTMNGFFVGIPIKVLCDEDKRVAE